MKIRNGFVSNSSSSSFIILGFKTNETPDDLGKFDNIYLDDDSNVVIGYLLADDEYLDEEIEIGDFNEKITEISEFFNIDISEIKLHCGTRMC